MSAPRDQDRTLPWIAQVLLDRAPAGVALLDGPDFTYAYVNDAFRALAPGRAFLGRPFAEVSPEVAPQLVPVLRAVQETGQEFQATDQRIDARRSDDGPIEQRWFSFTVQRVGQRTGAVAIHATDRTEAVLALRAAEEAQAEQVAEAIPQLVWRTSAAGATEWINRRFWEYTGLAPCDPATEPWRDVLHEHDAPRILNRWMTSLRAGSAMDGEARLRGADGSHRWHLVRALPVRGQDGRVTRWFATCTDVEDQRRSRDAAETARRRAEQAVDVEAHRAAQLDAVLEAIADGLVISNRENEFERANATALRLLGPVAPGSDWLQRFGVHDEAEQEVPAERVPPVRALRGEVVRGEELRLTRHGEPGPPTWLSVSAAPVRDPSGAIQGVVTTFADITRLRELQERQSDLLRAISHDLRTPLTVIMTQAQLLQRRPDDPAAVARRADVLRTSAQRMASMIDDLVDLVRLEAGLVTLQPCAVALSPFVQELRDRLRGALPVERLRLEVPPGLAPARADPPRLERILVNLISNALKYSPPETEATVSAAAVDGQLRLTVADRGPGLLEGEGARVFERFYRSPSASGKEGLGLGLYITRLLVEAHGGSISVDSVPGAGAAFHVTLPVAAPPA